MSSTHASAPYFFEGPVPSHFTHHATLLLHHCDLCNETIAYPALQITRLLRLLPALRFQKAENFLLLARFRQMPLAVRHQYLLNGARSPAQRVCILALASRRKARVQVQRAARELQRLWCAPNPIPINNPMACAKGVVAKLGNVVSTLSKAAACRSYYTYSNEPSQPIKGKEPKWTTAEDAFELLKSGTRVSRRRELWSMDRILL